MAGRQRFRVSKPATLVLPPRRSARIEKLAKAAQKETRSNIQLPSPSPSQSITNHHRASRKRRYSDNVELGEEGKRPKKPRVTQEATNPSPFSCPIACWAATSYWPKSNNQQCLNMSSSGSNKRRSSSTHHTDRQQRLERNGVYIRTSAQLRPESRDLCDHLLSGELKPDQFPCYPIEKVPDVLDRAQRLNEARLQRDVTPWVVPSPENLILSGNLAHRYIGEEIQAEWIRCETMGGSRPKPDFSVGLQRSAFDETEWAKLEDYMTPDTFDCTPNLWFPFLVCEVKTGRVGLDFADIQNIHSGSIAVRSILRVCIAAYGRHDQRVKDLLGRVLVFTVSHNNQQANIYGHYAVAKANGTGKDEDFDYYRYVIDMFSLEKSGLQRYRAYNFVRNVYDKFAPEHRNRLRDAIGALVKPGAYTVLSLSASELAVDDEELSQRSGTPQEATFKTPSEPASAATRRGISKLMEQLEQQRVEGKEQLDSLLQQLDAQRRESKKEKERMERQMEQQKQESKKEKERMERQLEERMERQLEERMERQLEEQRRESREQLEQWKQESKEEKERMERQMEQQRQEGKEQMDQFMSTILSRKK